MNNQINLGIQIVPIAEVSKSYSIIDKCIGLIQASGVTYQVTPFETVLEGSYRKIMDLTDQLYDLALSQSDELVINIRIHAKRNHDVFGADKTEKFEQN